MERRTWNRFWKHAMEIDIVVPVWNRPMETRSCLVSLIEHSPGARFILIDNGCDREAERLLQEFAEALDQRALLICTGTNLGIIKAINIGLERAEARYAAIVRNTCLVTGNWLKPLLEYAEERPDAGLLVPPILSTGGAVVKHGREHAHAARETSSGSLVAMVVRKEVHDRIGGLDEELDSGFWCIRDYTRRAYRAGFLTFAIGGGIVGYREETPLGSASRREEIARRSAALFTERWGEEHAYCIFFPKGIDSASVQQRQELLLKGARQGHVFTVVVPHAVFGVLLRNGFDRLHENIRIESMPRFFVDGAAEKVFASLRRTRPDTVAVTGIDGFPFPGVTQSLPFSSLERVIMTDEAERYDH